MEYEQATGNFYIDGVFIERGFSGVAGVHQNNPESQCIKDTGPIPRGRYKMDKSNRVTKVSIKLTPFEDTYMCDPLRDNFLIHGDKVGAPGTGSTGCIILSRTTRQRIHAEIDRGNDVLVVR